MFSSKKTQCFLLVVLVSYTNAGMIQSFIQTLTGSGQSSQGKKNSTAPENLGNQTQSRQYEYDDSGHYGHTSYQHYYYPDKSQNQDLYSLLGGIAFAGLFGAFLLFLANNGTGTLSGRKRRSLNDGEDPYGHIIGAIDDPFWETNQVQTTRLY